MPMNVEVEVDPAKIPYGDTGLPGSLLDIAMAHGVEIDHACGGVCACSTCHVYVKSGMDCLSPITPRERMSLAMLADRQPNSRLACQAKVLREGIKVVMSVNP
mgnify:CR=1 FL=1